MVDRNRTTEEDEESVIGLLKLLWGHRRFLMVTAAAAMFIAIVLSGIHFVTQPVRWIAYLEFRPTFKGAETGEYPNGLPFAASDIIDPSVLDQVFDTNNIQDFCTRNNFRSAFVLEQRSSELQVIDFEYQSRLADTKLTGVDRQRLLDEYRARRASAPSQYGVTFVRPGGCKPVPEVLVKKLLDDVLHTWAVDSETKRGVLKQRVRVLSPKVLDVSELGQQSLFVRANLVWINLDRLIRNIAEVQLLPGAELVRFGEQQVSLAEVKARMEDVQHAHLESLMTSVGAERDRDSIRWVEEALATASSQYQVAQNRARVNLDALREYSGTVLNPSPPRGDSARPQGGTDVQSLTPQIDRTFIDRILEMSEANIEFRQELTRATVTTSLEAVESEAAVNHYKQLLATLKSGRSGSSETNLSARLVEIVAQGQRLAQQFNGLYDEWSRVAFRASSAIYQVERPAAVEVVRAYSVRSYASIIVVTFLAALLAAALGVVVRERVWPAMVNGK